MEGNAQLASKVNTDLRRVFATGVTRSYEARIRVLNSLKRSYIAHEKQILAALLHDLNRSEFGGRFGDVNMVLDNINYNIDNLSSWMKNESRDPPFILAPASTYIKNEPFGVALVIGTWNFPFCTTFLPVVSAIAAGNCVCLKPSEISSESSKVMNSLVKGMAEESVACVEGGVEVIKAILDERWDIIAFTGSPEKGKLVAAAAVKYLTPTLLELGGKCPVIVDKDADMSLASSRVMQGRFFNCGQICIAPDTALVHESRKTEFLNSCKRTLIQFFGEDPKRSPDLGRIVSDLHFNRVCGLLENHGGEVVVGSDTDASEKYIAPTIILNPNPDSKLGREEVFGPILLVYTFKTYEEVKNYINEREKPLTVYYFGKTRKGFEYFANNTSSGGMVWNDTVMHYACSDLGFGGVGNSGNSKINGKDGFLEFSNRKGILEAGTYNGYPANLRYPPHLPQKTSTFFKLAGMVNFTLSKFTRNFKRAVFVAIILWLVRKGFFKKLYMILKMIIQIQYHRLKGSN